MARINFEQAKEFNSYDSSWLRLADDGDIAKVQFFAKNETDVDVFAVHRVGPERQERMVNCLREYNDPIDACPFCQAKLKAQVAVMLAMVDVETQEIKIWQRGKTFLKKLQSLINRNSPFNQKVFEIERQGAKGDTGTRYEVYATDEQPLDISQFEKPEFLGNIILELSVDDMHEYLDTGKLPEKSNEDRVQSSTRRTTENVRGRTRTTTEEPTRRRTRGER